MLIVFQFTSGSSKKPPASPRSISTGAIVAIVVILVVIVLVIVGIFVYKYRQARDPTFQYASGGHDVDRPSKLTALRSRVKAAMTKSPPKNFYYDHSRDEIVFDDNKPFVDHGDDEL